jgi:D-amino-acid dehydrogenase
MPEVVVVGGGIIGASAGYSLARAGAKVTLVDGDDPGTATNAAAGIISALDDNPPHEEWSGYAFPAMRYYSELANELEDPGEADHSFRVMGELKLSVADDPEMDLKAKLAQRQALIDSFGAEGIGTNVSHRELGGPQDLPATRGSGAGNLARPDRQRGRTEVQTCAVARHAEARRQGCAGIRRAEGEGRPRRRSRGRRRVPPVRGRHPGERFLGRSGSCSARTVGRYVPGAGDIPPIVGINGHYVLSFPDDRVVFGATRERDVFEHDVTVGGLMENIREVARIIPSIESASPIETRVGFRPFTTDRIPHIGWACSIDGLRLGLGISSQGMTMGAHTGATLADQALGVPGREIPAAFKPRV